MCNQKSKIPMLPLNSLTQLTHAKSRSISAENPTGEPGAGGRATEGTGAECARDLGQGWKISPSVSIPAKSTHTVAEMAGPGAVTQIWLTLFPDRWRRTILRMYWDDEETPSIEVPVGDFFCSGWCQRANITSLAVNVNPAGGFNCYWEMPFRKSARITLENLGDEATTVYYQVNYELKDIPADAAYFHAQWRRSNPLPYKGDHTLLDGVQGWGHYVGTYIAWGVNNNGWWGEGEIKFYMDDDRDWPTICGTGTEDYFGGAWNFEGRVRRFQRTVHRPAAGDQARRAVSGAAALRHVPLAHHRPGALRARAARDDSGARLALRTPLPAVAGRHRLDVVLVSERAARAVPGAAGSGWAGSHLVFGAMKDLRSGQVVSLSVVGGPFAHERLNALEVGAELTVMRTQRCNFDVERG